MVTSLLRQKGTTSLRNKESIAAYCQEHEIPHSHDFHARVTPDTELRAPFSEAYTLTPLQDFGLQNRDTSTVLVFESKQEESHHGEVVSAIADQVGRSLTPEVNSLYLHTSLNPNYRKAFEGKFADSVKKLAEDQNISVLHTSVGWKDKLLDFNAGHDDQANHLWRVTAFIVDSAGNDGKYGSEAKPCEPFQKHNALSHFAPLVVHVGAAALNEKTPEGWSIEGYSSANSPTFLAPVANRTKVMWKKDGPPEATIGTSAAAPYASGSLAALNCRYGQYLTREQILYAVLATCTPVTHVKAANHKTPEPLTISYKPNAVGHVYNPEYGGFGLMHVHKADQLLAQMVALTQDRPESITVPTEERVTLHVNEQDSKPDDAGLYHYHLNMPPGFALKTTVEADFVNAHGDITITSPSGTTFPMVMSKLDSDKHHFGMSTSHAWLGEKLEGSWTISSTKPIKSLRLSQHHFLEKDIIQELFIPDLLNAPAPNLHDAVPLAAHIKRVLHTSILPEEMAPHGLRIGAHGAPPELGDVKNIVNQLKALPSGFKERKPEVKDAPLFINRNTIGGQMEAEAIELLRQMAATPDTPDEMRLQAIEKQLAAASAYESEGKQLEQVVPMCNAAFNYLALHNPVNADGELNAEKAVALYQKALPLREETPCRAYRILCDMYTALAQCCEHGKADQYGEMLKTTREKILHTAREQQGGVDENAHRIEEGEFGYSDHEKIGTDNISQCITIIAQDPHTLKTGLAHVDNFNDIKSLDAFFAGFGEHRLNIRLIGARFTNDQRTDENLLNTMEYLSYKNADIISADIYDNDKGPSAVVVEPNGFKLTEKVPAKSNLNELPSNAMHILTRKGKPLIQQFDYTVDKKRQPIHMNARVLKRLREKYFGNPEWEIDAHLKKMNFFDRPLVITHLLGMEQAYHEQWDKLNAALEAELIKHGTGPADSEKAREALLRQTFYVGENATEANAPLYDWIENKLFVEGRLQRTQLEGPTANSNVYDPPAPPEVPEARGFRRD